MTAVAKKVMVLGIDCPIVPRMMNWARQGKLPTLKKMLERGTFAPNCLVPFPTITPPNWTSIATGAWPGTHGITDFDNHIPGTALDLTHKAFDSREVLAEALWTSAERVGKRTILMNYPTTWPSPLKEGWQVGGFGCNPTDWRLGVPSPPGGAAVVMGEFSWSDLCHDLLLATEPYPFASEVKLRKASGWKGVEHSSKALDAEVRLATRRSLHKLAPIVWHVLVDATAGQGYDTVYLARSKDRAGVFARLRVGEWTPSIYDTFKTEKGPRKAVFRAKLLELSPDGRNLRIYIPGLCALDGNAYPESLSAELEQVDGLPEARAGWESFLMEWIDGDTLVETIDFNHDWLAAATIKLMQTKPWDLYFLHVHTQDWIYHTWSMDLDPVTAKDPALREELERIELALYQGVDRCIGRIIEAADDETLFIITSDHGGKAKTEDFHVQHILEAASFVTYLPATEGQPRQIDWSKTSAVEQRSVYVYINVQGRDPNGIVQPGEEYAKVQDRIIKALYEYVDPNTGLRPVILALKKQDARILGLYGDRIGDVIYAMDPRFGKEHGHYLPTAEYGIGDLRGLFIMAGPGVRQGAVIERTVWLTDIAPTICHLAELPVPKDCEGAVIYQAIEDPDANLKELQSLRRNVERLKRMVERPPMC
jgi:predicted AlkP superfamily phosphohydrolase/phosphomutase